jgi:hypothetical protein
MDTPHIPTQPPAPPAHEDFAETEPVVRYVGEGDDE